MRWTRSSPTSAKHRVAGRLGDFFSALRHIDLLGHLAIRLAADAHDHLAQEQTAPWARHPAETFSQTAAHVGRALAHYTQALTPLAALTKPGAHATLDRQLDAIDHHKDLHVHVRSAHQALDEARASLTGLKAPSTTRQGPTPPPPDAAARTTPLPTRR